MRSSVIFFTGILMAGCSMYPTIPPSLGETNSGYTYIPLDPLPVFSVTGRSCGSASEVDVSEVKLPESYALKDLLDVLPDNAVRMAIKEYSGKGKISFAASSVGTEGSRYQVVLDYINVDSTNIRFFIKPSENGSWYVERIPDEGDKADSKNVVRVDDNKAYAGNIVIPVYVGVGLRLTADIKVLKGTVNLASLGAIAASVEGGNASGSLVVQTIGVTGKQVSTSLPMPSELNQTTVQTAILSLGAIKAIIYDKESALITPRVTGIYLPLPTGSEQLVNNIVSELARYPIRWRRGCKVAGSPIRTAAPT